MVLVSVPAVLGFVAAGVLAFVLGWVSAAVAALVVGLAASCLVAVLAVLHGVALALALLFRAVAVLWRVVQDMGSWLDLDTVPDDGRGGGGDDLDDEPEPELVYGRVDVVVPPSILSKPRRPRD